MTSTLPRARKSACNDAAMAPPADSPDFPADVPLPAVPQATSVLPPPAPPHNASGGAEDDGESYMAPSATTVLEGNAETPLTPTKDISSAAAAGGTPVLAMDQVYGAGESEGTSPALKFSGTRSPVLGADEGFGFPESPPPAEAEGDGEPVWFQGWDEGRQMEYYFNSKTKKSIWTKPFAPFVPLLEGGANGEERQQVKEEAEAEVGDGEAGEGDDEEEREWFEGWDAERQALYYFNATTKASTWVKPDAPFVPYSASEDEEEDAEESRGSGEEDGVRDAAGAKSGASAQSAQAPPGGGGGGCGPSAASPVGAGAEAGAGFASMAWIPAGVDERQCRALVGELLFNADDFHAFAAHNARSAPSPHAPQALRPMVGRAQLMAMAKQQLLFELDAGKFQAILLQRRQQRQQTAAAPPAPAAPASSVPGPTDAAVVPSGAPAAAPLSPSPPSSPLSPDAGQPTLVPTVFTAAAEEASEEDEELAKPAALVDEPPGSTAPGITDTSSSGSRERKATQDKEPLCETHTAPAPLVVRSAEELSHLFVDLLLDESKFLVAN